MTPSNKSIPYGYCHCGCGQRTKLSTKSSPAFGCAKGDPMRYVVGHSQMGKKKKKSSIRKLVKSLTRHGHAPDGKSTPTYQSWYSMKNRCSRPTNRQWKDYGGRGIKVCDRWMKFDNFLCDMGVKPDGMTIERINNDGDYEPGNCRWATHREQQRNMRNNRIYELDGERRILSDISTYTGIPYTTIFERLKRGMTIKEAIGRSSNANVS